MQLIRSHHGKGNDGGYTTIDLLVAAALSLIALGAFAGFNRVQLFTLRNEAEQSDVQVTARNIVDLFSREVRRAGANPTCAPGISAIATAKRHQIRIQIDANGDGAVTGTDEDVTYSYWFDRGDFERTANGNSDALIDGVTLAGSRIRYYSSAGVELSPGDTGLSIAERGLVRRVRIELVASADSANPYDSTPRTVSVANDVDLRNRFFANSVTCP